MLKIRTNLDMIDRFDATVRSGAGNDLLASGYQGVWAVPSANGFDLPTSVGTHPAYMVWTEGNYNPTTGVESIGFTPDATQTTKLTFLAGKFRILTNMFEDTPTPTVGSPMCVNATTGKLIQITDDGNAFASGVVAHVMTAEDATTGYLEIQTF